MPFKSRAVRLEYHRRYFQEHREQLREQEHRGRDATNARRRERHHNRRAGKPDTRTTHGKTDTVEYRLLSGAKKRTQRSGLRFDLTVHDIPAIPDRCPVLDIALQCSSGRMSDASPSLDRIEPKRGYVSGNVRVISWRANRLRSDASAAELRLVAADAERLEGARA